MNDFRKKKSTHLQFASGNNKKKKISIISLIMENNLSKQKKKSEKISQIFLNQQIVTISPKNLNI